MAFGSRVLSIHLLFLPLFCLFYHFTFYNHIRTFYTIQSLNCSELAYLVVQDTICYIWTGLEVDILHCKRRIFANHQEDLPQQVEI